MPVDLVISLRAWGNMFPVRSYLDAVLEITTQHAVVILDIRRHSSEIGLLKRNFATVEIVDNPQRKHLMVRAER